MPEHLILVVDDDPAIREFVAHFLMDEGYRVETAANGARALAAIERSLPTLVLLDMRMPIMDGWTFARRLRERGIEIPIVVMTAAYGSDAQDWAAEIAAADCIAKPFDLTDLIEVVERIASSAKPSLPPTLSFNGCALDA